MFLIRKSDGQPPMFWLLAMSSLDGVASALLNIFLPIYFLTLGYSVEQVLIYFIASAIFTLLFFIVAAALASFFSLRLVMLARIIPLAVYLWLFYVLQEKNYSLVLLAFFVSMQSAFYWFCLHFSFTKFSSLFKIDKDVRKLLTWPRLVALVAPLIGGLIMAWFGFKTLLFISFIVYSLASVMVFYLRNLKVKVDWSMAELWRMSRKYHVFSWAVISEKISNENGALIFPLVVFLSQKSFIGLGLVGTLVAIGGAIFPYGAAYLSNKLGRRRVFMIGSVFLAIVWLLVYVFEGTAMFYAASLAYGFLASLVAVPFTTWFYHLARGYKVEDFLVFNELPTFIGRMIVYSLALLFISHLSTVFLCAAGAYLLFYFFSRRVVV